MIKTYVKKIVLPTLVMLWATVYYIECRGYSLKSRRLVQVVFFMMLGLYVINAITDYFVTKKEWRAKFSAGAVDNDNLKNESRKKIFSQAGKENRTFFLFLLLMMFVLCLNTLGFIIATLVFSAVVLSIMGERRISRLVVLPIVLVITLFLIFNFSLNVPLPIGFLGV